MAELKYKNVNIRGIYACVPSQIIDNHSFSDFFSKSEAESITSMTGIRYRRKAASNICSSDLCYVAAKNMFEEMQIDPSDIDALIFVSLTPDYRMPATAFFLQHKLKMSSTCMTFDLNMGCSGYIYGLSIAFNLLNQAAINKVLLLNGETKIKVYPKTDKATSLLFGDGGAATLIESSHNDAFSYITLHSDGSKYDAIIMPAGAYRNPTTFETLQERIREDGSIRSDEHVAMNGAKVFDFTITEVPKDIKRIMELSGSKTDDIDYVILHQANKFITNHIAKKLKIPLERVPYSLDKFGNTSSVSIPLTIVSELWDKLGRSKKKLLLSGFGVGLSWGSAIIEVENIKIGKLLEI